MSSPVSVCGERERLRLRILPMLNICAECVILQLQKHQYYVYYPETCAGAGTRRD